MRNATRIKINIVLSQEIRIAAKGKEKPRGSQKSIETIETHAINPKIILEMSRIPCGPTKYLESTKQPIV